MFPLITTGMLYLHTIASSHSPHRTCLFIQCVASSTWSVSGVAPCSPCIVCATGVKTACVQAADTVCEVPCVSGATWSPTGNGPCAVCDATATCTAGVKAVCTATSNTLCYMNNAQFKEATCKLLHSRIPTSPYPNLPRTPTLQPSNPVCMLFHDPTPLYHTVIRSTFTGCDWLLTRSLTY